MLKKRILVASLTALICFVPAVTTTNVLAAYGNITHTKNGVFVGIKDTQDLEILKVELEKFVSKNPNSTELEQDIHLRAFIESGQLTRATRIKPKSIGDYLTGYNSLNTAERGLALKHPVQAIKVYDDGKVATSKTEEVYGRNGWLDNSDAFRHCLWNALMKKSIGISAAESWATAHEYNSSGVDKQMDLYNNSIGRSINVTGQSISNIVSSVKYKVKNGNCKRVVDGMLVPTNGDGMK